MPDHEGQRVILRSLWQILDAQIHFPRGPAITKRRIYGPGSGDLARRAGSNARLALLWYFVPISGESSTTLSSLMAKARELGKSGARNGCPRTIVCSVQ